MIKTFIAGLILGLAGAGTLLYYTPLVDQAREESLIIVHPNHGNTETFHVNVPDDRILVGTADEQVELVPPGLQWPVAEKFASARAELFKIRNTKDAVVGVASRIKFSPALRAGTQSSSSSSGGKSTTIRPSTPASKASARNLSTP